MADQPTTPSGSRWEPNEDDPARSEPERFEGEGPTASDDVPAYDPPGVLPPPAADDSIPERRALLRGRAVLAGAAAALTLGGGLTGFVLGHSTAGDGNDGFRPAGFSGPPGSGRFGDQDQQQGGPQDQQQGPGFGGPGDGAGGTDSEGNPT